MHHPRLVRPSEPDAGLNDDAEREILGQRSEPRDELLHVLAAQVFHDEKRIAALVVRPRVENERDVLRLDRTRRSRLALEALDHPRVLLEGITDDFLHRDAASSSGVARLVHRPHATLTELPNDLVLSAYESHNAPTSSLTEKAPRRTSTRSRSL